MAKKQTIWVATIEHRHGTDAFTEATEKELYQRLREYVDSWWDSEIPNVEKPNGTDNEIVSAYFDNCGHESVNISQSQISVPVAKKAPKAKKPRNYWGENKKYPLEDWRYEVANNDTRKGYWEWVEAKKEQE